MAEYRVNTGAESDTLVTLNPKTARQNRADLDVSEPLVVTLLKGNGTFTIVDGLNVLLHHSGQITDPPNEWSIKGDRDLGQGQDYLEDIVIVTVVGEQAVDLGSVITNVPIA